MSGVQSKISWPNNNAIPRHPASDVPLSLSRGTFACGGKLLVAPREPSMPISKIVLRHMLGHAGDRDAAWLMATAASRRATLCQRGCVGIQERILQTGRLLPDDLRLHQAE